MQVHTCVPIWEREQKPVGVPLEQADKFLASVMTVSELARWELSRWELNICDSWLGEPSRWQQSSCCEPCLLQALVGYGNVFWGLQID